MNLDSKNLWINIDHKLDNFLRSSMYDEVQKLEKNGYFFTVTDDTIISYDDAENKTNKYLTIAKSFDQEAYIEGPELLPVFDQKPYLNLLKHSKDLISEAVSYLDIDLDLFFNCSSIIVIPERSTFIPHIDSFRKCNLSFPLSLEGSTTYWLTPKRVETIYDQTTLINTEVKHSVENRSDAKRFLFQLNFKYDYTFDQIKEHFNEYARQTT